MTEAQEQEILVQWLRLKKIFHFAPVLENNTHGQNRKWAMIAEVKAKKQGKVKGTSDLFVLLEDKLLIIEMKRKKKVLKNGNLSNASSKPTPEQEEFIRKANLCHYVNARVCYGYLEAQSFIEEYLK